MTIRAVVVDDTILYRKTVSDILNEVPEVEVVGTANNGQIAVSRIASLKPDLVTLDIEMPIMNGLETLQALQAKKLDVAVIMLSSLTQRGSDMTMKALEFGAYDFISKPDANSLEESKKAIRKALLPIVKSLIASKGKKLKPASQHPTRPAFVKPAAIPQTRQGKSEIVAIGISTGGPNALTSMIPSLHPPLGVPIVIVQHMPPMFTKSLANSLNGKCALHVKEAENGETLRKDTVYIAPGGKQMKVALGSDARSKILRITNDPPENNCRPSVDYLFRSIAHHYLGRATAVIMTGMGNDGTTGMRLMKRNGAFTIAQDESSCVVFGMPKEAIKAGVVEVIAPLDKIADEIKKTI